MPPFAWRRRMTRHFGEQWVPFADLSLRGKSGRWHDVSFQVDSGVVASVLAPSLAELLGIDVSGGHLVELAGLGGPTRQYYVHECTARIGDLPDFKLRIAFADREDVPNLLGRLDVLDRFQIDFNPTLAQTRFDFPS